MVFPLVGVIGCSSHEIVETKLVPEVGGFLELGDLQVTYEKVEQIRGRPIFQRKNTFSLFAESSDFRSTLEIKAVETPKDEALAAEFYLTVVDGESKTKLGYHSFDNGSETMDAHVRGFQDNAITENKGRWDSFGVVYSQGQNNLEGSKVYGPCFSESKEDARVCFDALGKLQNLVLRNNFERNGYLSSRAIKELSTVLGYTSSE